MPQDMEDGAGHAGVEPAAPGHDPKDHPNLERGESPPVSTPSVDGELHEHGQGDFDGSQAGPTPERAPKRKGGRKPIYATSEERKQRNRQAQAAFRERRTGYIKDLEHDLRSQSHAIHSLTATNRQTMEECLMLRYRNSLLIRILVEKGIDVAAELRETSNGDMGLNPVPPPLLMQPPRHLSSRSMTHRHNRRSGSFSLPVVQPGQMPASSPAVRPTVASPTRMDGFGPSPVDTDNTPGIVHPVMPPTQPGHHGMGHMAHPSSVDTDNTPGIVRPVMPPTQPGHHGMGHMAHPSRMMPPMQQPMRQPQPSHAMGQRISDGNIGPVSAPFYQSAGYQSHVNQLGETVAAPDLQQLCPVLFPDHPLLLEQEYDMDDHQQLQRGPSELGEVGSGPAPYPASAYVTHAAQQVSPISTMAPEQGALQPTNAGACYDPFGLDASMQFPPTVGFAFPPSNMRC